MGSGGWQNNTSDRNAPVCYSRTRFCRRLFGCKTRSADDLLQSVLEVIQTNYKQRVLERDPTPASLPAGQVTMRSDGVLTGLQKAMEALVKAQDYLNTAADQSSDAISKAMVGIVQNVRGLQRDVSNVIHSLGSGR